MARKTDTLISQHRVRPAGFAGGRLFPERGGRRKRGARRVPTTPAFLGNQKRPVSALPARVGFTGKRPESRGEVFVSQSRVWVPVSLGGVGVAIAVVRVRRGRAGFGFTQPLDAEVVLRGAAPGATGKQKRTAGVRRVGVGHPRLINRGGTDGGWPLQHARVRPRAVHLRGRLQGRSGACCETQIRSTILFLGVPW
jgi:hypothetical protein